MRKLSMILALSAFPLCVKASAAIDRGELQGQSSEADLAGINQTVNGLYLVISGPQGQKRDFVAMRALFAPNALLRVITPAGVRGGTLDDYINRNSQVLEKEGFNEIELGRRVEVFGNLASVWSAYDGRTATGSFHERGINSFQLVRVSGNWLVASILWQEETKEFPLPKSLLKHRQP